MKLKDFHNMDLDSDEFVSRPRRDHRKNKDHGGGNTASKQYKRRVQQLREDDYEDEDY